MSTLYERFHTMFNASPDFVVRAPGRVNLIGEHVDYNDGWVLPVAIDRAAHLVVRATAGSKVELAALDLNELADFELPVVALPTSHGKKHWPRYAEGVAWALHERGLATVGLQAALMSDVPRGAGLSSSAAVEVAYAVAWQHLGGWRLDKVELARVCQRAENAYVGVNSGLMDQFASVCGVAHHALLFDCRKRTWQTVPLPTDVAIVVADTMVRRTLAGSEYNTRRAQCEAAVHTLARWLPHVTALRDVAVDDFNHFARRLDPVVERRARHVVEECARTRAAADDLRAGRLADFGARMNECHRSLRDLYEVSCHELDVMVQVAQQLEGCYGARLTGAGFGGCTVNLVAASAAATFTRELAERYHQQIGVKPDIYVCRASDGAQVVH